MDRGFEAGRHLHAVAFGAHEGADPEAMQDVTQLTPLMQPAPGAVQTSPVSPLPVTKQGTADGVLLLELEAAMEAALELRPTTRTVSTRLLEGTRGRRGCPARRNRSRGSC